MKLFKIIRSQEWWGHKLPPLLAVAYATTLLSGTPIVKSATWILCLLLALVIGAIYVSVLNDITDLQDDLASGKTNRIQLIPAELRWLFPAVTLVFGLFFTWQLFPDLLSCILYLSSWIAFSLYSIRPVRLKNRGIFGVIADGCGSHLFPTLLIISSISYVNDFPINWTWFAASGSWAFFYGIRGILWHQFEDRENDLKVKLHTVATHTTTANFKNKTILIFSMELVSLSVMLYTLSDTAAWIALGLYVLLVLIRYDRYKNQVILIIKNGDRPFQILMADYYQVLFPISLLVTSALNDSSSILILLVHMLLFPFGIWLAVYDYVIYSGAIFFRRYRVPIK